MYYIRKTISLHLRIHLSKNSINPFSTEKSEKLGFSDSNNSKNFKHSLLENHNCKVYQSGHY